MEINETVNKYFAQLEVEEDFYDSSIVTYKRKIKVFHEYVRGVMSSSGQDYCSVLTELSHDSILESIEGYIYKYNIGYKATIDCF